MKGFSAYLFCLAKKKSLGHAIEILPALPCHKAGVQQNGKGRVS